MGLPDAPVPLSISGNGAKEPVGPWSRERGPKIAMYSHDALGLGHMRRNLLIADVLRRMPIRARVLLIGGAGELSAFNIPEGVDCVVLPGLRKGSDGSYRPRSLNVAIDELVRIRAGLILSALRAFSPDILVVDKHPRGILRELEPALQLMRTAPGRRVVLGLRDILDEPEAVKAEWARQSNERAVLDYYDAVWVYGDARVFDPVREYDFPPEIARRVHFTGYLDPSGYERLDESEPLRSLGFPPGRLALCQVGGGEDGGRVAVAFARADLPPDMNGLILTGPYMPRETRRQIEGSAAGNPRLRVLRFVPRPLALVNRCDRLVAMGGYNTVQEVLAFAKPALIVPREHPRREQVLRARLFADMGLLNLLPQERLDPAAISSWLHDSVTRPAEVRSMVDLGGLSRLRGLVEALVSSSRGGIRAKGRPPAGQERAVG